MQLFIDNYRICNNVLDLIIGELPSEATLNDSDREEIVEGMVQELSNNTNIQMVIEDLLISMFVRNFGIVGPNLVTLTKMLKNLGGMNND